MRLCSLNILPLMVGFVTYRLGLKKVPGSPPTKDAKLVPPKQGMKKKFPLPPPGQKSPKFMKAKTTPIKKTPKPPVKEEKVEEVVKEVPKETIKEEVITDDRTIISYYFSITMRKVLAFKT